jgi:outer membrane lipoprotein-sorting protein
MIKNLLILLLLLFSNRVLANEQDEIIKNIEKINSLYFNFQQINNNNIENGYCNIIYPSKIHCIYDDNDEKQIIVENNNLIILEKDGKKNSYQIDNGLFQIILNKEDLINTIKKSQKLDENEKNFIISTSDNQNNIISLYFNKKNYLISGWKLQNYDKSELQFILDKVKINVDNKGKFALPN